MARLRQGMHHGEEAFGELVELALTGLVGFHRHPGVVPPLGFDRYRELSDRAGEAPVLASRLQDFFGLRETPRVAGGAVPVVLQLLAPNQRPVQITTDLASFWSNVYPKVRSELRRRYPKHAWPEDPLAASRGGS